jgi:DNA polymerase-2
MISPVSAWLFDLYPVPEGLAIWLIEPDGRRRKCWHPFRPSFYLHLRGSDARRAVALAPRCPVRVELVPTTRTEIFSGDAVDVFEVFVHDATRFAEAVRYFERFFPHHAFYNSDLLVPQLFLYATQLFPLGFGEYLIDDTCHAPGGSTDRAGKLVGWSLQDDRNAVDYQLPPLTILRLRNANDLVPPKYQRTLQLEVAYDGQSYALEQDDPASVVESLNWHLHRADPDIVLTEYGDGTLMPRITEVARKLHMPLLFNRDTAMSYRTTKESSFFQYGKIVHKDGAFEFSGRWHVDQANSFTVAEAHLDGLYEMVRLTQMPGQRQSRASIGTSMSSLQQSWAYRHGILIPAKKREPEEFKSAATLLLADRGGLIFNPPLGYHEEIAEMDFVSMYPTIMVRRNVSPETINCRCCHNERVPELGYTVCERREGIVAATLADVVKKRSYYKQEKKRWKGKDDRLYQVYDHRQTALKWMLVSCFGYLGYKNARFGRIEAHESVNAFSRDAILTAKEIAERAGYQMLHAIIDCVWLKKPGATEQDYEELGRVISREVNIDISLEGIYRWILFPASKQDPAITTANRYVGWYHHDEIKMRGIEARRRDTPPFVKHLQASMLRQLEDAKNVEEVRERVPAMLEVLRDHLAILRSGRANPMELVLRRHLTREAEEYTTNTVSAVVSKMLHETGIRVAAGEMVELIIVDRTGKKRPEKAKPLALYAFEDGYDIDQYTEFALKAAETLLTPFGWDFERLKAEFVGTKRRTEKAKKVELQGVLWDETLQIAKRPKPQTNLQTTRPPNC